MSSSQRAVPAQWGRGLVLFGRMIRFSHTVFAMPFAFAGVLFAWHVHRPVLEWGTLLWVALAMVGARTAAMGFNRIVDRRIDAANPRTADRELPQGKISILQAVTLVAAALVLFFVSAAMLNPLCLMLSPPAAFVVLFYSLTKRFTWASHFVLGLGLALAPLGGWVAVSGSLDWPPVILGGAVLTWIAGMDIYYALQDEAYDRQAGLYSVPSQFGRSVSLTISLLSHTLTVALLVWVGQVLHLSVWYGLGVALCAAVLVYEHLIVRRQFSRVNFAFFDMNGLFSMLYMGAAAAGVWL